MKVGVTALCTGLAAVLIFPMSGLAQSKMGLLPSSDTILSLAEGLKFFDEPVASGPVVPKYAPNFHVDVNFRTKMLNLTPGIGAIAGKVTIKGVPAHYGIPDGSYYLWMGIIEGHLRTALATMDGALQKELCAQELPQNTKLPSNTLRSSIGPTPCARVEMAQGVPGTFPRLPPPLPRLPPKPPPTQKRTIQDICYTENGDNPVTKYRKGVVYVPDS